MSEVNWYWVGAAIIGAILILIVIVLVAHGLKSHIAAKDQASIKAAFAHVHAVVANAPDVHPVIAQDPAAPAASDAVHPPAAAPTAPSDKEPSAGGGGTDHVAAKQAELDAEIAQHTKAIEAALAKKQAIDAAQAALKQLTEGA